MKKYKIILLYFLIFSCERILDEEKPEPPQNFRGFFTLINNQPLIRLAWDNPQEGDIEEFHIFRTGNNLSSFDSLTMIDEPVNIFTDTSVFWGQQYWYKIRLKDKSTNTGNFSDSITILCYKPIGVWNIEGFDSSQLCVDPIFYTTNELLRLSNNTSLESIGDTSWILEFPKITIDTIVWFGNGMMHFSYITLENSNDGIGFDTVSYANTTAPEPFTIDFSNMNEGAILFGSENQQEIRLEHQQQSCGTDQLIYSR